MKIWCQSVTAVGKSQLWQPYEQALKKHMPEVVRPGTTAELHGVEIMSSAIGWLRYAETLNTLQCFDNAIKAEKQGYDAFVVACMVDPGFYELRQIVDIPVVSAGEACFYVAGLLAPKFAIIGYNASTLREATENIKRYGLGEKLVPTPSFSATLEDLANGFKDPAAILKSVREIGKKAAEQGAAMLVPACGILNMVLVTNKIKEVEGVPVMDILATQLKVAELLVDLKGLGLDRSRLGAYARVSKEELSTIRKLYHAE